MKKVLLLLMTVATTSTLPCGGCLTFLLQKLGLYNRSNGAVVQSSVPRSLTGEIKTVEILRDALVTAYKRGEISEKEFDHQISLLFWGGIFNGIDRQTLETLFSGATPRITKIQSGRLEIVPQDDGRATVYSESVKYGHPKND